MQKLVRLDLPQYEPREGTVQFSSELLVAVVRDPDTDLIALEQTQHDGLTGHLKLTGLTVDSGDHVSVVDDLSVDGLRLVLVLQRHGEEVEAAVRCREDAGAAVVGLALVDASKVEYYVVPSVDVTQVGAFESGKGDGNFWQEWDVLTFGHCGIYNKKWWLIMFIYNVFTYCSVCNFLIFRLPSSLMQVAFCDALISTFYVSFYG